jgi:hypothetical protein
MCVTFGIGYDVKGGKWSHLGMNKLTFGKSLWALEV